MLCIDTKLDAVYLPAKFEFNIGYSTKVRMHNIKVYLFTVQLVSHAVVLQDVFLLNSKKLRLDAGIVNTVCVASQLQPIGQSAGLSRHISLTVSISCTSKWL